MNVAVLAHCIIAGGSLLLGCQPISRTRTFSGWAKLAFASIGFIGVAASAVSIALELGWWSPGPATLQVIQRALIFAAGLACGLILALFASGELFGRPRSTFQP